MFRIAAIATFLIAGLTLSACGHLDDNMEAMGEKMTGGECNWSRYVDGKDFCRHDKAEVIQTEPLYCYQSVGEMECFRAPQKGRILFALGSQPVEHETSIDKMMKTSETKSE